MFLIRFDVFGTVDYVHRLTHHFELNKKTFRNAVYFTVSLLWHDSTFWSVHQNLEYSLCHY